MHRAGLFSSLSSDKTITKRRVVPKIMRHILFSARDTNANAIRFVVVFKSSWGQLVQSYLFGTEKTVSCLAFKIYLHNRLPVVGYI